jgi:minor extracellular serine protease Vpr
VALSVDNAQLELALGKEAQLMIKEVTTGSDGNTTEKDVTKAASYKVENKKVVAVKNGVVSAKNAGSTTITVKYGKNEVTVDVTVTK